MHDPLSDLEQPASSGLTAWSNALRIAALLASSQKSGVANAFRGIRLKAGNGPVRDAWLAQFEALSGQPITKITPEIPPSRLLTSVDLSASLATGHTVRKPGLLDNAAGHTILLTGAERLPPSTAAIIATALDRTDTTTAFCVIALDEGQSDEDALAYALAERLPVVVDLHPIAWHDICATPLSPPALLSPVATETKAGLPVKAAELAASLCHTLDHRSVRPMLAITEIAQRLAGTDQRDTVNADDMATAIEIVTGLALNQSRPDDEDDQTQETETSPPSSDQKKPDHQSAQSQETDQNDNNDADQDVNQEGVDFQALQDMLVEATKTGHLQLGINIERDARAPRSAHEGKSGTMRNGARRGRPAGIVARPPYHGARLDVIATLRNAAPWQRMRRSAFETAGLAAPERPLIRASDYRFVRYRQPTESVAIFAVDASGSTALDRLSEAKGAIEQLLAECYVRRDSVALVTFRGHDSSIILEPTRSLVRAKRSLTGLPGGGGTPLASGLKTAVTLATNARTKGKAPLLIMLTDGRGNIALDGRADRSAARKDAETIARQAATLGIRSVFIDIARRPRDSARELAQTMHADYCALPRLDARQVSGIVSSYMDSRSARR